MQPARRGSPARAVVAVVALLLGLASLGVWRIARGTEHLPFDPGATPPASVHVTKGSSYSLAVPGGVPAMLAHGVPTRSDAGQDVLVLQCSWAGAGAGSMPLTVSAESTTTKAETTVAHFVAPVTGRIHVDCAGWGAMFVPDSDDRQTDWGGAAILAATILLTIGASLALCEARIAWQRPRRPSPVATGEQDEVE